MEILTLEEYNKQIARVLAAAIAYHKEEMLMDDAEYDRIMRALREAEEKHPDWAQGVSPTEVVGGGAAGGDVVHARKMLSLDNVFNAEELEKWEEGLGGAPVIVEPKLDGLAISATYERGKLVFAATRGDGVSGDDVSRNMGIIDKLPARLDVPWSGEIRGEVVLTKEQFEAANISRLAAGKDAFLNKRNGAAGVLRSKEREYEVRLTLFTYDAVGIEALEEADYKTFCDLLEANGFLTASKLLDIKGKTTNDKVKAILKARPDLPVDIDGAVIKAAKRNDRQEIGNSERAPKWAIAYKYPPDTVFTTLLAVEWQVGRTGVITPRAVLEPVVVGDVTVTYATLHNPDDIARKGFKVGDKVSVYRAGDVVPRVEAPVINLRTGEETEIELPKVCPDCGRAIVKDEARWRCIGGRACAQERTLEYACSRKALDIEGLGKTHIKTIVGAGLATSVADLFRLKASDLSGLDRLGDESASKIIAEIDKARTAGLGEVFTALSIRGTGSTLSRRMAKGITSLEALLSATKEDLMAVPGIGNEKAEMILSEIDEIRDQIEDLATLVTPTAAERVEGGIFAGMSVCISGTVTGMSRDEAKAAVERNGGRPASSVSKTTSLFVEGPGAGSKAVTAANLQIKTITTDEFLRVLAGEVTWEQVAKVPPKAAISV